MTATILVVGAGGQVGTELLRRAPAGFHIVGLTRAQLDVTDAAAMGRAVADIAPALIINASAYTAVDKAEDEPDRAYAVNRDGPAVLARACAAAGIPLLHISTDYVFDGKAAGPYAEDAPTNPLSVYGASKLAGEQAVQAALEHHVILRISWVFAAHGGNFVKTMLRLGAERPELRVVDDQHGGPSPAAAIADALFVIARRVLAGGAVPWGTYHYGGAPATTWRRFAETIFAMAVERDLLAAAPVVTPIATADYPTRAVRPGNSVFDCAKIRAAFGIAPADWRDGLAAVLDQLKRGPE